MTTPAPLPLPPPLIWAITYTLDAPDGSGRQKVTELLTPAWCRAAGYQPDQVRDPIRATWCLAIQLAAHDAGDAELISVTAASPPGGLPLIDALEDPP